MKVKVSHIAVFISSIISCNDKPSQVKHIPNDTFKTLAVFELRTGERKLDYIFQVAKDTVVVDSALKARRARDTFYYIPNFVEAFDSTGKRLVDSAGKPIFKVQYNPAKDSQIIWNSNVDIDTLLKQK